MFHVLAGRGGATCLLGGGLSDVMRCFTWTLTEILFCLASLPVLTSFQHPTPSHPSCLQVGSLMPPTTAQSWGPLQVY